VLKNYGLKQDCFVFDLNVRALMDHKPDNTTAKLLPKFPSISQDVTLIVDKQITAGSILSEIHSLGRKEPLVETFFLFDAYEGRPLAQGKKSLSFRIIYRSENTTLKEKKVQKLHAGISENLVKAFHAGLPE
jgi:phenylalanyl-tRNA synthetase beta chain